VRRPTFAAFAAATLPLVVLATTATAAPEAPFRPVRIGHFVPAHPGLALPTHDATVTSLNWAGYVDVPGRPVTAVSSNFTVPTAKATPPGFSASWAGIGGYSTSDLIQAGTAADTFAVGGPKYFAWYEVLPDSERRLLGCTGDAACTVRPGDRMYVNIHQVGRNLWSVTVANARHWSWHSTVSYASSRSSAEWILEAPTLVVAQTTVAQVGTAYFGRENTWAAGGPIHAVRTGHPVKVNMGVGLVDEAVTSGLASNWKSFNVCTYQLSCPTPAY
jgi:Peptidase A4 family